MNQAALGEHHKTSSLGRKYCESVFEYLRASYEETLEKEDYQVYKLLKLGKVIRTRIEMKHLTKQ
jgi:hypothetical protein